jgi:aspartyl-tRNA(Asn)/glutamyl-tRNA(Gln) amidotransferase subunit C
MALTREEVRRIARLAHLELDPDEEARMAQQLSAILDYVKQLEALDVSQVEPMTHALAEGAVPLREDEVAESLAPETALGNAPARAGTCFKVPRIIE